MGAGPAGLGAAHELVKNGIRDILIIDRNRLPGGLARTEIMDGARFDIGPHRFFTKNTEVMQLWHDLLGEDFKPVKRLTRIYYKRKYFNYPIEPVEVLVKLGLLDSFACMYSLFISQLNKKKPVTFEDWIVERFGRRLFEIFFKTYTEKIWGIPCGQIGLEWASQRIKGLDAFKLIKNGIFKGKNNKIRTLVAEFNYPSLGAGQMYEAMCAKALSRGAVLMPESDVIAFNRKDNVIDSVDVLGPGAERTRISAKHFFSSMPLADFFGMLDPPEPPGILESVGRLRYRGHITVDLLIGKKEVFADQWIYIHAPDIKVARIANYNNFSKAMVKDENTTALSAEYFVFKSDKLWSEADHSLIDMAVDELVKMGLIKKRELLSSRIVREPQAYPVHYLGFQGYYELLKSSLGRFVNLSSMGRAGLHKYNNQDHSIISGILAARNYLKLPGSPFNLWDINIDPEYQEGG